MSKAAEIEWIGRGVNDPHASSAFIQFLFGVEALLTFQEGLISPSLASNLAECAAFILKDDLKHRLDVERRVRKIYERRGAVVHSGKHDISEEEAAEALLLVKSIIGKLVTKPEFEKMTSIQQLIDWVKNKKYE